MRFEIAPASLTDLIGRSGGGSFLRTPPACYWFLCRWTFTKKAVMLAEIFVRVTSQKLVLQFRLSKAGRVWRALEISRGKALHRLVARCNNIGKEICGRLCIKKCLARRGAGRGKTSSQGGEKVARPMSIQAETMGQQPDAFICSDAAPSAACVARGTCRRQDAPPVDQGQATRGQAALAFATWVAIASISGGDRQS